MSRNPKASIQQVAQAILGTSLSDTGERKETFRTLMQTYVINDSKQELSLLKGDNSLANPFIPYVAQYEHLLNGLEAIAVGKMPTAMQKQALGESRLLLGLLAADMQKQSDYLGKMTDPDHPDRHILQILFSADEGAVKDGPAAARAFEIMSGAQSDDLAKDAKIVRDGILPLMEALTRELGIALKYPPRR